MAGLQLAQLCTHLLRNTFVAAEVADALAMPESKTKFPDRSVMPAPFGADEALRPQGRQLLLGES